MKLGLIGLGYWGNIYAKTLNKMGLEFDACTRDYEELILNNSKIEAVIIATPPETHYKIMLDAMKYNKHILCEKPFTTNSKDAVNLLKLFYNKIIMVGHIYLYHPSILRIKEILKTFGPIKDIQMKRLGAKCNKNSLWELGSHDIYILDYLINNYIKDIKNVGTKTHQKTIIDYGDFKATIETSTDQEEKVRTFNIIGENQTILFDDSNPVLKLFLCKGTLDIQHILIEDNITPLEYQCQHFINCIKNDERPRTDGFSGLKNIETLEKCSIL